MSGRLYLDKGKNILYWAEDTVDPFRKRIWRIAFRCKTLYSSVQFQLSDLIDNYHLNKLISIPLSDLPLYISWEVKSSMFGAVLSGRRNFKETNMKDFI